LVFTWDSNLIPYTDTIRFCALWATYSASYDAPVA